MAHRLTLVIGILFTLTVSACAAPEATSEPKGSTHSQLFGDDESNTRRERPPEQTPPERQPSPGPQQPREQQPPDNQQPAPREVDPPRQMPPDVPDQQPPSYDPPRSGGEPPGLGRGGDGPGVEGGIGGDDSADYQGGDP